MILDSQKMTEPQVNNDIKTIVIDTNNHNERQLEINDDTDFNNKLKVLNKYSKKRDFKFFSD